jgi:N,N-dimethylformamidase beta subunit-like protein
LTRFLRPAAVPVLVFAGLVVATFAAFFVTTRLKRAAPVIEQLTFRRSFSPNGDGRFDTAVFAFRLRRSDEVTVSMVTRDGDQVRTLAEDVFLERGARHGFRWDGRTDAGRVAPDGEYHLRVGLRNQGRTVTSSRKLFLDTVPPRMIVRYVSPDSISPDGEGHANTATLRFTGPSRRARLLVYRTDLAQPRLVARREIPRGDTTTRWDGYVTGGGAAPTGSYLLVVRAQDAAGNVGPRQVPPPPERVRGHPGLTVSYVAASGPDVVRAGTLARFDIATDGRRYRWSVRRLGARRSTSRGTERSSTLTVRAPRGRSGVALLTVRVGARRYTTPFAVRGQGNERVLVVLPAASWQARNRAERDGDGYPDVLPAQRRVNAQRAFAGDGLPPGFVPDQSGVLRFLDRERLPYEITTDLELAEPGGPDAFGDNGVLYAGAPRFAPRRVQQMLATYVEGGGRLAWIGRHGFEWSVGVATDNRGDASELTAAARERRTPFGERVRPEPGAVPVAILADRAEFFAGVPDVFGPFGPLEESRGLPRGTRVLAAAGTGAERPAVVIYRRGAGVVARVGIDGFGRALGTSPAAERIMRRLWVLLSR